MTPHFALNLSHDGIELFHRQSNGWVLVGTASLDDPEFSATMAGLRRSAAELAGGVFTSKLLLPSSQILYTDLAAGPGDAAEEDARIRTALDGATPYPLDELVYDWTPAGDRLWVAVVARVTLAEAEGFAMQHGFNPVAFAAIAESGGFEGEAFFGTTDIAATLLPEGVVPVRDPMPFRIVPAEVEPEAPSFASVRADTPSPEPVAEPVEETPPTDEVAEAAAAAASMFVAVARDKAIETPAPSPAVGSGEQPEPTPAFASLRARRDDPAPENRRDGALTAEPHPARAVKSKATSAPARKAPAKRKGGRKRKSDIPPAPPPLPAPGPIVTADPRDETESMTIFGARPGQTPPRRPRYLGLVLTLGLVVFLGLVGVWSAFFSERGGEVVELAGATGDLDAATGSVSPADPVREANVDSQGAAPAVQDQVITPSATAQSDTGTGTDEPPLALTSLSVTPETALPSDTGSSLALQPDADAPGDGELDAEPEPLAGDTLSLAEAQSAYAETGIWQKAPVPGFLPDEDASTDIYIASIDPMVSSHDAVALPSAPEGPEDTIATPPLPVRLPPGTEFRPDGLVVAKPDGALTPDGILIFTGKPQIVPPRRPGGLAPVTADPVAEGETVEEGALEQPADEDPLHAYRPRTRPDNLIEETEKAQLGGLTRTELAALRPRTRPQSIQDEAEAVRIAAEVAANRRDPEQAADPFASATAQATTASLVPRKRPSNIAQLADRARKQAERASARQQSAAASTAAVTKPTAAVSRSQRVQPKIPSRSSVAKQATIKNAVALNKVSLIGVYGSPSQRRALVRLPSGRYVKVQVGDRLDGGRVSAISESKLNYKKGSRNLTLALPKG